MPPKKRGLWTEESLKEALHSVHNGMSVLKASEAYGIPRRTLRDHIKTDSSIKRLGRRSVLNDEQESELCRRIIRLGQIGMPLTNKVIRRSVYSFVQSAGIRHCFNQHKNMAGRKWLKLFLKRHPQIVNRKAQVLNPARAQKVNRYVVNDYFLKLKQVLADKDLFDKPQLIYNMDEKGCRLTLHHQQQVLTQKGSRRVHIIAPEHAENVTVVACGNALGQAIPPMVLFKGKRLNEDWQVGMPPGTKIVMTPKGSMTSNVFVQWLKHFSRYKVHGHALLIFDGAASHLDISIVEAADKLDITLFCLPSNTTHELQPLDKCVFRSFEHYWDEEVLNYWTTFPERKITRARFGIILSKVFPKAMSPQNLQSAFRSTGIFPYNPSTIPDTAFAPSSTSYRVNPETAGENRLGITNSDSDLESDSDTRSNDSIDSDEPLSHLVNICKSSEIHQKKKPNEKKMENLVHMPSILKQAENVDNKFKKKSESQGVKEFSEIYQRNGREKDFLNLPSTSKQADYFENSLKRKESVVSSSKERDKTANKICEENRREFGTENKNTEANNDIRKNKHQKGIQNDNENDENNQSLSEFFPTPDIKTTTSVKKRKAINSTAQVVVRDLFSTSSEKIKSKKNRRVQESWYCFICQEDRISDMRLCVICNRYVHEECVGLSKNDKISFVCIDCEL